MPKETMFLSNALLMDKVVCMREHILIPKSSHTRLLDTCICEVHT